MDILIIVTSIHMYAGITFISLCLEIIYIYNKTSIRLTALLNTFKLLKVSHKWAYADVM